MTIARDNIMQSIVSIAYFMRASVQYDYLLYHCTYYERHTMSDFIQKRLEAESDKMYPVY